MTTLLLTAVIGMAYVVLPGPRTGVQTISVAITTSVAAIGLLWTGSQAVSRFLLWESASGAQLYERRYTDPMQGVAEYFSWLLRRSPLPVVFFVEDLDRCPPQYVVALLDAMQTLIREAPNVGSRAALFVVAADGSWLRKSYEVIYRDFAEELGQPGRPLGYLFLDKLFQLTLPVAAIGAESRAAYLRNVLRLQDPAVPTLRSRSEAAVIREEIRNSGSEAEVLAAYNKAGTEAQEQLADVALARLIEPSVVRATEHDLEKYASLLPSNPRSVKLFVNAYSILRAVRLAEANPVPVEVLAAWIALRMQWPKLADHLETDPDSIEVIRSGDPEVALPGGIREVITKPQFVRFAREAAVAALTGKEIREASGQLRHRASVDGEPGTSGSSVPQT